MIVTKNWIECNYQKFNRELWDGKLPNIEFKVGSAENSWGSASYKYDIKNDTVIPTKIIMSNYYDSPEDVKIQTLLHEMIHIADYTFNPHHFIKNGRRISGREYDAHGSWFLKEAKRISKASGYTITNHVTRTEVKASKLSDKTVRSIARKENTALVCVVTGDNGTIFWFKTDIYKIKLVNETLKQIQWYKFNTIKSVKYYTFENSKIASYRSCGKSPRGWYASKLEMMNLLRNIKATEVYV